MEQIPKSEGKCLFCGETFTKTGITRHLQTHLRQKTKENTPGQSYLVKVELNPKWGSSHYFLLLWIDSKATMKNIDRFLRNIWLECCGHLSAFTTPQSHDKVPVSRNVDNVFCKGLKLEYKYDFGSTTELLLTVVEEYPVKTDDKIVLLSRNEPLEWLCDTCKKEPATQICTVHDWDDDSLFCEKCAEKHAKKCEDFKDYAAMPVVNSPRMGVCGYEGGTIDIERDGVFTKKQS